jgi:hypothetical protein
MRHDGSHGSPSDSDSGLLSGDIEGAMFLVPDGPWGFCAPTGGLQGPGPCISFRPEGTHCSLIPGLAEDRPPHRATLALGPALTNALTRPTTVDSCPDFFLGGPSPRCIDLRLSSIEFCPWSSNGSGSR